MEAVIELSYDPDSPELPEGGILASMAAAARIAAAFHRFGNAEVSLTFVSPQEIRALNREHRGVDEVTDVLSFPQWDGAGVGDGAARDAEGLSLSCAPGESGTLPADCPVLLGDVVICTERALAQAAEGGRGEARELVYLFAHGLLHLLGYDHGSDGERSVMRGAEERIMREAGL
jgi:probable rRNA maturation factor